MALKVEGVLNGGMHAEETLGCSVIAHAALGFSDRDKLT
jgi:hypothetical protein